MAPWHRERPEARPYAMAGAAGPSPFPAGPEALECARGTRLGLLVTATVREAVAGGHRECPGVSKWNLQRPPRGGVTSWGPWEKGQVGIGNISEAGCARASWECPPGPDPDVTMHGQQPGRAGSHGFIQCSTSVQRLLEEEENHGEGGNASPEPHVLPLLQGTGTGASPPSAWWLKQIFQVRLPEPLLPVPVFGKFPQHGHHVGVEFRRRWLRF